jgi:hypothetical protein
MRFAIGLVYDIGAGGRDRDQFQIGKPRKRRFAHWHFIYDRDCRILETINDLVGRGNRIFLIAMRKSRRSQLGLKSRTVEKDDRVLHGVNFLQIRCVPKSLEKAFPRDPHRGSILSRHSLDDRLSELRLLPKDSLGKGEPAR